MSVLGRQQKEQWIKMLHPCKKRRRTVGCNVQDIEM